ncbi:LigB family dioxygenase [mine drainage metagenome]|uniref:LigB family dioxygenase n=1 Tax=mine drainage metagenome TaxID=410659 RepID=A0A1J5S8J6_9ZZZZ
MNTSAEKSQTLGSAGRMPALFLGHGNPMNAITENPYRDAWLALGKTLPRPKAILCISAHWQTNGTQLCVAEHPETIHDFGGFPPQLFAQQYPAPGAPQYAESICNLLPTGTITPTLNWGLDHGAWTILQSLFPAADIPVLQLSLDTKLDFAAHFTLATQLASLREQGIMIIGSGNIVHNLSQLNFQGGTYDWAVTFDNYIKVALETNDDEALIEIVRAGDSSKLSVPTIEHYLPLLYIAAVRHASDQMRFFNETFDLGALSMRSVIYH